MRTLRWALALVGLSGLGACSGVSYQCGGVCTAPDEGSVSLSFELSAITPADAEGACPQKLGFSLCIYCSPKNSTCTCQ